MKRRVRSRSTALDFGRERANSRKTFRGTGLWGGLTTDIVSFHDDGKVRSDL